MMVIKLLVVVDQVRKNYYTKTYIKHSFYKLKDSLLLFDGVKTAMDDARFVNLILAKNHYLD